jgi:hypothetical protein
MSENVIGTVRPASLAAASPEDDTSASGFEQVLPRLVSAYERGVLVPFLGAGMSAGACPTWSSLLEGLELEVFKTVSPGDYVRRANRLVAALTNGFCRGAFKKALRGVLYQSAAAPPPQLKELARIWWPLVLTTNYDDLFLRAQADQCDSQLSLVERRDGGTRANSRIVGRSARDCQAVIRSLSASSSQSLVWALHGYLSSDADEDDHGLSDQIVLGHAEYRRLAHASVVYRRAFAEVYRRRSLLVLGSSLEDQYLLDLFAEVQELYGPSDEPHFALMDGPVKADVAHFLRTRFNIHPVFYGEYSNLVPLLRSFREAVSGAGKPAITSWSWTLEKSTVRIECAPLPDTLGTGAAVALSAGWNETDLWISPKSPASGASSPRQIAHRVDHATVDLIDMGRTIDLETEWPLVYARHDEAARLALAVPWSRSTSAAPQGQRDLRLIFRAMEGLLRWASANSHTLLLVPPLGSGRGTHFAGRYSVAEMLRAWSESVQSGAQTPDLVLHVIDEQLQWELRTGKLDVSSILAGGDLSFWIEIEPPEVMPYDRIHRFPVLYGPSVEFGTVCDDLDLPSDRMVVIDPSPTPGAKAVSVQSIEELTLREIGVVVGATLRFSPPAS